MFQLVSYTCTWWVLKPWPPSSSFLYGEKVLYWLELVGNKLKEAFKFSNLIFFFIMQDDADWSTLGVKEVL